jgi:cytochrome c oxidase assembly protein subunit 19
MKFTENKNAPNCRILAKQYLGCRMDHELMEKSDWDSLGLINLPGEKTEKHLFSKDEEPKLHDGQTTNSTPGSSVLKPTLPTPRAPNLDSSTSS